MLLAPVGWKKVEEVTVVVMVFVFPPTVVVIVDVYVVELVEVGVAMLKPAQSPRDVIVVAYEDVGPPVYGGTAVYGVP